MCSCPSWTTDHGTETSHSSHRDLPSFGLEILFRCVLRLQIQTTSLSRLVHHLLFIITGIGCHPKSKCTSSHSLGHNLPSSGKWKLKDKWEFLNGWKDRNPSRSSKSWSTPYLSFSVITIHLITELLGLSSPWDTDLHPLPQRVPISRREARTWN